MKDMLTVTVFRTNKNLFLHFATVGCNYLLLELKCCLYIRQITLKFTSWEQLFTEIVSGVVGGTSIKKYKNFLVKIVFLKNIMGWCDITGRTYMSAGDIWPNFKFSFINSWQLWRTSSTADRRRPKAKKTLMVDLRFASRTGHYWQRTSLLHTARHVTS